MVALRKAVKRTIGVSDNHKGKRSSLLAAGVLGHSLGTLAHCVLRQLTREVESHGSLDLPAGDRVLLVVVG